LSVQPFLEEILENLFRELGKIIFFVAIHSVIVYLCKNFVSTKLTLGTTEELEAEIDANSRRT